MWEKWVLLGSCLAWTLVSCGEDRAAKDSGGGDRGGAGTSGGGSDGAGRSGRGTGGASGSVAGRSPGGGTAGTSSSGGAAGTAAGGATAGAAGEAGFGPGGEDAGGMAGSGGTGPGESCPATGAGCAEGLVCSTYGCINPFAMPNTAGLSLPNSRSYDTTTDGVVVDRVTGLMWEATANVTPLLNTEAATYCGTLGLAGYDDWRVPTRLELVTIVEYGATNPALDRTAFAATEPAVPFMTASASTSTYTWQIDFAFGETSTEATRAQVRCVRSSVTAVPPEPRYVVNADGTVFDRRTRLTWQREIATTTDVPSWAFMYDEAVRYCEDLQLAGGGYRLPTMNELSTLIVDRYQNPALDNETFPTSYGTTLVASTEFAMDEVNVWYATLVFGYAGYAGKSNNFVVRCVR